MKSDQRSFLKKTALGVIGTITIPNIIPSKVLGTSFPSNRINVAIIGCGRRVVSNNIPQLLDSKQAQIVAVCDVDSWRLANAQKQAIEYYSNEKGTKMNGSALQPQSNMSIPFN
jgi:myo-inositol 2-dehydrogenase/D-chiro-inositol 1-dehydrogenase